jgi:hypothetical protein
VRVDESAVKDWVAGLLKDQDEGKTEAIAYSPDKTTASVVNDTDIGGLAAAVSEVLTGQGFTPGEVGNHEGGHVSGSQVRAPKADDLGAVAVAKALGNLPIVEDPSVTSGSVKVVLAGDYTGPGSGLGTEDPSAQTADPAAVESTEAPPPPSPILTAGSDDPACVS